MSRDPKSSNQFAQWLDSRNANRRCPVCGTDPMSVGDLMATFSQNPAGHPSQPFARLECRKCGYVRLFDARHIGLV